MSGQYFENNEKTFPIFKILLRKSLIIILVTVLCALIGLGYAIVKTKPSYTASKSVIFRTEIKDGGNLSNNQTNQVSLAKLYLSSVSSIIRSDAIMTKSKDNLLATSNAIINATEDLSTTLNRTPTAKEIADELSISVSHVEDVQAIIADSESGKFNAKNVGMDYKETSLIFTLSYTDKNENFACAKLDVLVDTIAENLGDYVQAANVTLISTQHENDVSMPQPQVAVRPYKYRWPPRWKEGLLPHSLPQHPNLNEWHRPRHWPKRIDQTE